MTPVQTPDFVLTSLRELRDLPVIWTVDIASPLQA